MAPKQSATVSANRTTKRVQKDTTYSTNHEKYKN